MLPLQISSLGLEGAPMLLLIIIVLIWSVALVAIANGKFYDQTTKLCWFMIVLFLNIWGVLLFIIWGRKEVFRGEKPSGIKK